ncbi:putative glycolipid-binding domain-containing protein [Qaidamihabitans albus]|uniref:putative glycolipid-binding domain-containing protein n=1 Tax=Qaidamihabitans albus TaxID=2795733 RepID=UPI0018F13C6D|nr:putative glycolipid-binding domain-containing protein [Qaidamihabitans albus]
MPFAELPERAAWTHQSARSGFEVVFFRPIDTGYLLEGSTTAVEDGQAWIVDYRIALDAAWATRRARVTGRWSGGSGSTLLETDGPGHWRVDGEPAAHLDGCLDVDLESSAVTNALPVHRFGLHVGMEGSAPAAYVRALDLSVERLEQEYRRIDDEGPYQHFDYRAPAFDFACRLVYDESGLVVTYPALQHALPEHPRGGTEAPLEAVVPDERR